MIRSAVIAALCAGVIVGYGIGGGRAKSASQIDSVPQELRVPFRGILGHAVAAQESRDWKALYALQWPDAIEHEPIEKFIAVRKDRAWHLIDFSISSIDSDASSTSIEKDGSWTAIGCSRIVENAREESRNSTIRIYRVKGQWFAGEVGLVVPMDGGSDWPRCKLSDGVHPDRLWKAGGGWHRSR